MKLSIKSEYALLAMIHLARNYKVNNVKIADISQECGIPRKYLEQILLSLKAGRLVESRRGAAGGYELSRPPDEIKLAEILRFTDGALAPVSSVSRYFYRSTPLEKEEKILSVMHDIRNYISDKLENISLADVC